jgi:enoyl-CoA hydratase/carnithine racemase
MVDVSELSNGDLDVAVSDDELVIRATIDRPDQQNAPNTNVIEGLFDVFAVADETDVRVVVVRGAARRSVLAGR